MRPILYANLTKRIATAELSTTSVAHVFPAVSAGDVMSLSFRFYELLDAKTVAERTVGVRALRASVGLIDAAPLGGDFKIKVGNDATSALNTTAAISYNATASALAALLNAVPAVQALGVVNVWLDAGSFVLEWSGATSPVEMSVLSNRLTPVSLVRIAATDVNGRWLHEVRPMQAPLASAGEWSAMVADDIKVTKVKTGFIDASESDLGVVKKYPTVFNLYIPPAFRGLFSLRSGNTRSNLLDPVNDGVDVYAKELPLIFGDTVSLANPSSGNLLITLDGPKLNGRDVPAITVEVFNAPPGDPGFDLSLSSYELAVALRGKASITVPFEVEADIVDDVADVANLTIPSKRVTLLSTTLTIRQELHWQGLELVPQTDWLRPPAHESYIPFTRDQVITGTQSYVAAFGDGQTKRIEITHGLGTRAVFLAVRENSSPGAYLSAGDYVATILSEDLVRLEFPSPPAVNAYVLTVIAAGPKSAFEAHTHTMAQVVGLMDSLSDFDRRISALTPTQLLAKEQQNFSPLSDPTFQIPNMAELLPDGYGLSTVSVASQMVYSTGGAPQIQGGSPQAVKTAAITATIAAAPKAPDKPMAAVEFSIPALSISLPAALPPPPDLKANPNAQPHKLPPLLGAIRPSVSREVGTLPVSGELGTVYQATAEFVLPGGGGRKSRALPVGAYFAYDGRYWYQVFQDGSDYYPSEFEQVLFTLPVESMMLLNSKQLELVCSVSLSLASALQGQYTLVVEMGSPIAGAGPSFGMTSVNWTTLLLTQTFSVTSLETAHSFGVRVNSTGMESMLYGNWTKMTATPPEGNLLIRARLTKFDCENATDARGVLHIGIPATKAAIY